MSAMFVEVPTLNLGNGMVISFASLPSKGGLKRGTKNVPSHLISKVNVSLEGEKHGSFDVRASLESVTKGKPKVEVSFISRPLEMTFRQLRMAEEWIVEEFLRLI